MKEGRIYMPTFDFRCSDCGHEFSEFVSIKEKDKVCCPKCKGNVKQLFTGFMFKSSNSNNSSCSNCNSGDCKSCGGC